MAAMTGKRELTDRFVKTVKPAEKRIRYWDTRQKGLALVIEPTGHKSWKVAYRFAGNLEWFNLGDADKVGLDRSRGSRKDSRQGHTWRQSPGRAQGIQGPGEGRYA